MHHMSSCPISDQKVTYIQYQGALLNITMICGKDTAALARVNFMECQYGGGGGGGVSQARIM